MNRDDGPLRRLSLWWDTLPAHLRHADRPPLEGTVDADVAIVGAGFTGLWTAYYLLGIDPTLRVLLVEAEVAGFGASGRNGGWCSADFPVSPARLARTHSPAAARAMAGALQDTVTEVGRVIEAESLDCGWQRGGCLSLARTPLQLEHQRESARSLQGLGITAPQELDADQARGRLNATGVLGGTLDAHVAAVDPARLVRQLALAVEQRGATIAEHSPAVSIGPGAVSTPDGRVRARYVVRATEAYTAALAGTRRALAPVYSLMLATEPLPAGFWSETGLRDREVFTDGRHVVIYGQRTADDRIAFGGRGARYRFGSTIDPRFERDDRVHRDIWGRLTELIPAVADFAVTHTWGGPLGVPRDWSPSVGLDTRTGLGWSGGYVGDGVAAANLGGRTLADLITGRDTAITGLPWVNHRSPLWEPEPARWLGITAGNLVMSSADRVEARTGADSRRARLFSRFVGG